MVTPEQPSTRRKKTRIFELYINKVLKTINPTKSISNNPKQQLNSILSHIATIFSNKAYQLTNMANKKTISEKEMINTLKICTSHELFTLINTRIQDIVQNYNEINKSSTSTNSRQDKAGIIFPPSICEKYIRQFGNSKLLVSSQPPLYLAIILEFITTRILTNALDIIKDSKQIRLSIRELQLSVSNDKILNKLFSKNNLSFMGGGVVPYVHPSLLSKKPVRKTKKEPADLDKPKKHRFRPGTVALREIRKFQKTSNCLILSKLPFNKLVREKFQQINNMDDSSSIKISKDVFIILQHYIEEEIVEFLQTANNLAIHAGRIKLLPVDIMFANHLKYNKNNPYQLKDNTEVLDLDITKVNCQDIEEDEVEDEDVPETLES
jgi:histone H3/H4